MSDRIKQRITFQDVHYTRNFYRRFLQSLSEPISSMVICSPYFGKLPVPWNNIEQFCASQQSRGVDLIQVITRPPGSDNTAMALDVARRLASKDVEVLVYMNPYLHAKLYHFEYRKGYFRSFIGSSNFTLGGMKRNHEVVAEMEGVGDNSPCHQEIQRLLNAGATIRYEAWVAREMPKGTEEAV